MRSLSAVLSALAERGFVRLVQVGECGDYGWGSRFYFSRIGAACNDFGWPLSVACVSFCSGGWVSDIQERSEA